MRRKGGKLKEHTLFTLPGTMNTAAWSFATARKLKEGGPLLDADSRLREIRKLSLVTEGSPEPPKATHSAVGRFGNWL